MFSAADRKRTTLRCARRRIRDVYVCDVWHEGALSHAKAYAGGFHRNPQATTKSVKVDNTKKPPTESVERSEKAAIDLVNELQSI